MQPNEHATHLLTNLATIAHAADEAMRAADALTGGDDAGDAARWIPGIRQTLARFQLDCAEARFSAKAVREALPSPDTLQPRLL
jgi:hypothetical protein